MSLAILDQKYSLGGYKSLFIFSSSRIWIEELVLKIEAEQLRARREVANKWST